MLKLSFKPYDLRLNHVFRISRGARSNAPIILTRLTYEGVEGFGEGSMPPLYGETPASAVQFLSKVDLSGFKTPFDAEEILGYIDALAPGNAAAKASVDIALHDLIGKLLHLPVHQYFGLPAAKHHTSMTVTIDSPEAMAKRAQEFAAFKYLKIKLGTANDRQIIEAIRTVSSQPFFIDANQGWNQKEDALDFIHWLKEQNTVFIEQPMLKEDKDGQAWLAARSPLPIIGDEGVQRLESIKEAANLYHGINIKLVKSTGLREGLKMAITAKALGMKVMLGCMSETSCGISAAAQLGALADWVDLDGNLDTSNDPYQGVTVNQGLLALTGLPGIGLTHADWDEIQSIAP
ncbi:L-alanine-DL-glutamate epimerase [bacterium A37T11]|nr:L-alanine-DL-glutamate epimerase [bacterium A37T11]